MTELHEELLQIADRLDRLAERGNDGAITEPLGALKEAVDKVGRAFGGSWLGYHANVYYAGLKLPPPGAHFSQEWGLMDTYGSARLGSHGDWLEYDSENVRNAVYELAGNPDLEAACKFNEKAARDFDAHKSDVLSILETELANSSDSFLSRLKDEVDRLSVLSKGDVANRLSPKHQVMTRDTIVLGQENRVPPHISVLTEVLAIQHTLWIVQNLAKYARQAGSHLSRRRRQRRAETVGTNVFIGHGRSLIWHELKDLIENRLRLPVDEFNRVPVAGGTNIARLSEMLERQLSRFSS